MKQKAGGTIAQYVSKYEEAEIPNVIEKYNNNDLFMSTFTGQIHVGKNEINDSNKREKSL